MLELAQINSHQFLRGLYYYNWYTVPTDSKLFRYEIINPKSRSLNTVVENVYFEGADIAIKTSYSLGFKINDVIRLQDDKLYTVSDVNVENTEIAPDSMRYLRSNPSTAYILGLKLRIDQ